MASLEDETEDIATCSICLIVFDAVIRKPKLLQCGHYFCQECCQAMILANFLQCPKCRRDYELGSADIDGLPTNSAVMLIINQGNLGRPEQFWCQTCKKLSKQSCIEEKHGLVDLAKKEEQEFDAFQNEAHLNFIESIVKREKIDKDLKNLLEQLNIRMEENSGSIPSLREKMQSCVEMSRLSMSSKRSHTLRTMLDETVNISISELSQAESLLSAVSMCLSTIAPAKNPEVKVAAAAKRSIKKEPAPTAAKKNTKKESAKPATAEEEKEPAKLAVIPVTGRRTGRRASDAAGTSK